jgi:predicted nucleic acid-binding protein
MTLVLDSGGLSALAADQARLTVLQNRKVWPPQVPSPVLTESLTGDHRRDFDVNRLLKACQIRTIDEGLARRAALLRTQTGRAGSISATDAIVAAFALTKPNPVVYTSDRKDIATLTEGSSPAVAIVKV